MPVERGRVEAIGAPLVLTRCRPDGVGGTTPEPSGLPASEEAARPRVTRSCDRPRTAASPRAGSAAPRFRRCTQVGFAEAVIVPKAALPSWPLGWPNCGWLNRLNVSTRSSVSIRPILVFFTSDRSTLKMLGPNAGVAADVPVGGGGVGGALQRRGVEPTVDRSGRWEPGCPRCSAGSPGLWPLPLPVELMVPVWVMFTGMPVR